jgi:hypothetical protein
MVSGSSGVRPAWQAGHASRRSAVTSMSSFGIRFDFGISFRV